MALSDDVRDVIREIVPDVPVWTRAEFDAQAHPWGAVVEQRSGGSIDQQCDTQTVYADVTVVGAGPGGTDQGRARSRSEDQAWRIYRALRGVYDRTVNGDYYIRIMADTPPQEQVQTDASGTAWGWTVGVECVQWMGAEE